MRIIIHVLLLVNRNPAEGGGRLRRREGASDSAAPSQEPVRGETMQEKVLIPCPFCGRPAELRETHRVPTGYNYTPRCTVTSCAGRLTKLWMNKEDAIKAWNRRANDES